MQTKCIIATYCSAKDRGIQSFSLVRETEQMNKFAKVCFNFENYSMRNVKEKALLSTSERMLNFFFFVKLCFI